MDSTKFEMEWMKTCARLNKHGKCAKILNGEIDYTSGVNEDELTDIPGFEGKYKISRKGEVVSIIYTEPRVLKPISKNSFGSPRASVRLSNKNKEWEVHRVCDLYERTFGEQMEGV